LGESDGVDVFRGIVGFDLSGEELGGAIENESDTRVCHGDGDVIEGRVVIPDHEIALSIEATEELCEGNRDWIAISDALPVAWLPELSDIVHDEAAMLSVPEVEGVFGMPSAAIF